jgi:hypothetical protein
VGEGESKLHINIFEKDINNLSFYLFTVSAYEPVHVSHDHVVDKLLNRGRQILLSL